MKTYEKSNVIEKWPNSMKYYCRLQSKIYLFIDMTNLLSSKGSKTNESPSTTSWGKNATIVLKIEIKKLLRVSANYCFSILTEFLNKTYPLPLVRKLSALAKLPSCSCGHAINFEKLEVVCTKN